MGPMMRFGASANNTHVMMRKPRKLTFVWPSTPQKRGGAFGLIRLFKASRNAQHRATLCLLRDQLSRRMIGVRLREERNEEHTKTQAAALSDDDE